MKEAKEEVRERKGRGRLSTLIPLFPTPQIYLGSLNFYWLKIQQNMFFLIFLFDRSSSFRNDFACSNAPNRSVNRYDALSSKLFLCFGPSCHGVVVGHALHPVPKASLLHIYIIVIVLRLFLAQQERSQAIPVLSLLHIVIAGDHSQRTY
jgi:hypothetical protein